MNTKEKKQEERISQEELLKAIAALEEIVTAEMPKEWEEDEEEVSKGKLPRKIVHLEEKAKEKIRKKLMENGDELTRSNLYKMARGDRMGLVAFNNALQSLEADGKIAITNERTSGKPLERIKLLRANANLEKPIE